MNFTTADKVRMFLARTELDPLTDLPVIYMLIEQIDGVIKNYCGWEILAKDYTKTFSGDGSTSLDLDVYPLVSVASCTVDGEDLVEDLELIPEDGEVYFTSDSGYSFTSGTRNVVVTFNAGYATPPEDLSYAATYMAASNFRQIIEETVGIQSDSFKDLTVEYSSTDLPDIVKRVLDRYRKIKIF